MNRLLWLVLCFAKLCLSISAGFGNRYIPFAEQAAPSPTPTPAGPAVKRGVFSQFIDHNNKALGTFKQYYYYSDQYYAGAGSPIVVESPGEVNITVTLNYNRTEATLSFSSELAKALGAGLVILEHRYYGNSTPFASLTTANLQYLTLENAIDDYVYFAQTAKLPFDPNGTSKPDKAPWVLTGCSYPGSLAAYTQYTSPGTYWAYQASSAPVQAVPSDWYYFAAVQKYAPKNCSADLVRIIAHVDQIGTNGTLAEQQALKKTFGLQKLSYYDDFAAALVGVLFNWQYALFGETDYFQMICDTIEGVNSTSKTLPPARGIGLAKALPNFAGLLKPGFESYCEITASLPYRDLSCLDTHNASNPVFTDTTQSQLFTNRQFEWMRCNYPFESWATGAPPNQPSLISRFVTSEYYSRQCKLFFPPENGVVVGLDRGLTAAGLNKYAGGWLNTNSTRVNWVYGEYDGWRQTGISSDYRPGGPLKSTPQQPIRIIPKAHHCQDFDALSCFTNEGCTAVFNASIAQIKAWVAEFKPQA